MIKTVFIIEPQVEIYFRSVLIMCPIKRIILLKMYYIANKHSVRHTHICIHLYNFQFNRIQDMMNTLMDSRKGAPIND